MRPDAEYEEAMRWIHWGLNDCQIERLTTIPRRTILEWRHRRCRAVKRGSICPRCSDHSFDEARYSYLLGLYLGDGSISSHARGVYRLRIVQDEKYVRLIDECARAISGLVSGEQLGVGFAQQLGCIEIYSSWKHWPCVFPQHAPGRKMDRRIRLERWQQDIVDRYPCELLKGLIDSDGCRTVNVVGKSKRPGGYSYPFYEFSNSSSQIRRVFENVCKGLGIRSRRNGVKIVVSRRDDVALLDTLVGPKV